MGSPPQIASRLVRSVGAGQPRMRRARLVTRALADLAQGDRSLATHCEVATMLARRAGLPAPVLEVLGHAYERWDGKGAPAGLAGEAVPLAVRVVVAAKDADLAVRLGEDPAAWLRDRRGRGDDPAVVDIFARTGPDILGALDGADEWELALASEPASTAKLASSALDAVLEAVADFADLKSPWTLGHSRSVATLAEGAGRHAGLDGGACDALRRAGLVHDSGRVAVERRARTRRPHSPRPRSCWRPRCRPRRSPGSRAATSSTRRARSYSRSWTRYSTEHEPLPSERSNRAQTPPVLRRTAQQRAFSQRLDRAALRQTTISTPWSTRWHSAVIPTATGRFPSSRASYIPAAGFDLVALDHEIGGFGSVHLNLATKPTAATTQPPT